MSPAGLSSAAPRPAAARRALAWLALALVSVPAWAAPRPNRSGRVQAAARRAERSDRALHDEARRLEGALRASRRSQARRNEWERVVLAYRKLLARYPQSPYCDNALLSIGDLYRDMAGRFKSSRYREDALAAYQALVAEYPSSSLGEKALYSVVELARESRDRRRLGEAARAYLAAFPEGPRARSVQALVKRDAPERSPALPKAPPPGLAQVFNLRFWSGAASTRVVLDVERQVTLRSDRIAAPDRLWVDLDRARLHPNLKDRAFPVGDGLLEQVRIAQNQDDVVRVVLDFKDVQRHTIFYLQNPTRLVIDVQGGRAGDVAVAEVRPAPSPVTAEPETPAADAGPTRGTPSPSPAPTEDETDPQPLPTRRVTVNPPARPSEPAPAAARRPTVLELDLPAAPETAARSVEPPAARGTAAASPQPAPAPQPNRNGAMSLARQLGLGARRIVVDAGHGGHDPGTTGPGGLQEKDLVLDVALRLAELLRRELHAEVLLTRSTDVFIPLEERTAIANSKGADLFLSIHANSSRNQRARGIETYFLNFAKNPHAEAVAARENAISPATLKDLQGLVKAIALNSKIDESRDFAASVQEAMVSHLREHYGGDIVDRGVHTAPFYVLIGANMPSVLAEIAFVSHPEDERRLKGPEARDRVARGLLVGVRRYLEELNGARLKLLTRRPHTPNLAGRGSRQ